MNEWNLKTTKVPSSQEPALTPRKPFPPQRVESVDFFSGDMAARGHILEAYAAAFLEYTKLNPSECELVETRTQGETRWYFRRRV